jgi:hypothetical protein
MASLPPTALGFFAGSFIALGRNKDRGLLAEGRECPRSREAVSLIIPGNYTAHIAESRTFILSCIGTETSRQVLALGKPIAIGEARHWREQSGASFFVDLKVRFFVPTRHSAKPSRAGSCPSWPPLRRAGLGLDNSKQSGTSNAVGTGQQDAD